MDTRKGLAVLGSTGSVGVNTLDVVTSHPTQFAVLALAAHSNVDLLEEQVRRFRPRLAVLFDEEKAAAYRWSCQPWSALLAFFPPYAPCERALTWP